ncbi:MAG: N-acetyltransferase, partial [Streptococcus sp.]
SFEILYRGDHFDEESYRDIFRKLQEENYFDFRIKYRRFSDH